MSNLTGILSKHPTLPEAIISACGYHAKGVECCVVESALFFYVEPGDGGFIRSWEALHWHKGKPLTEVAGEIVTA